MKTIPSHPGRTLGSTNSLKRDSRFGEPQIRGNQIRLRKDPAMRS